MLVDKAIVAQLRKAAAVARGREICGALMGDSDQVRAVVDVANRSTTPETAFFIPAADVLGLEHAAESNGQTILGFYHSHPTGTGEPSAFDLEQALPGYTYLIIADDRVRAWRLRADRSGFDEIDCDER